MVTRRRVSETLKFGFEQIDKTEMAQRWEHSPLSNMSYVGCGCWFSTLHWEIFSGYSGFPAPQKKNSIWLDLC